MVQPRHNQYQVCVVFFNFEGIGKSKESNESRESRLFSGSGSGGLGIVSRMRFLNEDLEKATPYRL